MTTSAKAGLIDVTVTHKEVVADGVARLSLAASDGSELPEWSAGAHIALLLEPGVERQYSLCGDAGDRSTYTVAVLREANGRGGSVHVHDALHIGAGLRIRPPRNNFELLPADRYLFIAGGIGVTPILAMIDQAERSGTPWTLLYGGRSRSSMAFRGELEAHGDRVTISPQDESGLLDLATALARPVADTLVYCCGPEPLLEAVEKHCVDWPHGALRLERFTPSAAAAAGDADDAPFVVELASSGLTIEVPADRSILDCLEDAGVDIVASCREGTCGTCETALVSGEADHRDSVLTEDERASNESIFVCVSRCRGAQLVLDL